MIARQAAWIVALGVALATPSTASVPGLPTVTVDATIESGDRFRGVIVTPADVDAVRFPGLAGELLRFELRADPGAALRPAMTLRALGSETVLASAEASGKLARIQKVVLPATGTYELRIAGADDGTGGYLLRSHSRLPKALTTTKVPPTDEALLSVDLEAKAGARLKARFHPAPGSDALPGDATLVGPDGPIDLGDAAQLTGKSLRIALAELPATGAYTLDVERASGSGALSGRVRLSRSKLPSSLHVEPEAVGEIAFAETLSQVSEPSGTGGHDVLITLHLPPGEVLSQPIEATVSVVDDPLLTTAVAGSDYLAFAPQQVFFGSGASDGAQTSVTLATLDDSAVETTEQVLLALSLPSALATIGEPSQHTWQIVDDDSPPPPPPPRIASFGLLANDLALGDTAEFFWTLDDAEGVPGLTCTLDIDTDGQVEYSFDGCGPSGSQSFPIQNGGYRPTLLKLYQDGLPIDQESVTLHVLGLTVEILYPLENALGGPLLDVYATIASTFDVTVAQASVSGHSAALVFDDDQGWFHGVVDLTGLVETSHVLVVSAVDFSGAAAQQSRAFVFDSRPTITIATPFDGATASPDIAVDVTCVDVLTSPCDIRLEARVGGTTTVLASGQDSITGSFDLSAFDGKLVTLRVVATDSASQSSFEDVDVHVEASPLLSVVARVPGKALDADATRVLYRATSPEGVWSLHVYDLGSGLTTEVPVPIGKQADDARSLLTPTGVIFIAKDIGGNSLTNELYDWNAGALVDLGYPNSSTSLVVAGDYAIWNSGTVLTRRRFSTSDNVVVATDAGNTENGVDASGSVAWWNSSYQVHRWDDGVDTPLSNDVGLWNTYARIDGDIVLWRKRNSCCASQVFAIAMNVGGVETLLAPYDEWELAATFDFLPRNGWVAYTLPGTQLQRHVYLRDPSGVSTQLTGFAENARVRALSPTGEVMIWHKSDMLLAAGGALVRVSSSQVEALWAGDWRLLIGDTVFEVP